MVRNIDQEMRAVTIQPPQHLSQRTVGTLDLLIDEAVAQRPDVIHLAMGGVQSIDSGGLGWLVAVQERLTGLGMKLRLADPTALVLDILMATRLDTRLPVHCTMGSAPHA